MNTISLNNAEKIPGLNARKMFTSDKTELIHLVLGPVENLPQHSNPFDVIFYVLNGRGLLTVEGEGAELEVHDTVDVKAGLQRSWINRSDKELRLLVIKYFK